jgi:hypothetical protein
MNKKLIYVSVLIVLAVIFSATTAFAATKSYNGVTTVTYNNRIVDQGACCWNGGFSDSTSPSRSMDQFGATVLTTYQTCNGNIDYSTWYSVNNVIYTNVSSVGDGMARSKTSCPNGQARALVDYVQHWWQDAPYGGDGAPLTKSLPN